MSLGRILLFFLAFLPIRGICDVPNWICTVQASLTGEALFFWEKGQDAWSGVGNINCRSEKEEWSIDVIVRFESLHNGSGAGPNSKIKINSGPIMALNPYQLTQRLVVSDPKMIPKKITWESENDNPKWTFKVTGENQPGLRTSLSHGTLEIFIPQFSPRR